MADQSQGEEENDSTGADAGWKRPVLLDDHKGWKATARPGDFSMRVLAGQVGMFGGSFDASMMVSTSDENSAASSQTMQDEKEQ